MGCVLTPSCREECCSLLSQPFSSPTPLLPPLRSALAEAKIPPGPRLLILDHIDQYRDILRPAIGIEEHL